MTVTVNLPDSIELAYAAAAEARGVSIEELVNDVLLSNLPVSPITPKESALNTEWIQKQGIPVLRSGQPLSTEIVNETIDLIRRARTGYPRATLSCPSFSTHPFWFPCSWKNTHITGSALNSL